MRVALTYDDGPSEWTPAILDLLAKHDAKATFFVCENQIAGRELLLGRAHQDGHEIGNHTKTHPNLEQVGPRQTFEEIADCSLAVLETIGEAPRVFRPPYLRMTDAAGAVIDQLGMVAVGCSVMPGDWGNPSADAIAKAVLDDHQDGDVVLLHDGRPLHQPPHDEGGSLDSRAHVVTATRLILERLTDVEFVTVTELLSVTA